LEQ
jgi:isoleucyl-tRNA synthetase